MPRITQQSCRHYVNGQQSQICSLLQNTNARIYQAFQEIDRLLSQCFKTYYHQNGRIMQPMWADDVSSPDLLEPTSSPVLF